MKKVAVIILNFNGEEDTLGCLESLNKLLVKDYQLLIVVVDNGSTKQFKINNLKLTIGELKIIRNEENLGFAGGNNVGIRYALEQGSDYILIVNSDVFFDKNLVNELLKIAESDEKIGVVVPKIYFANGFEFHKNRYKKEELGKVIWYAGGLMDWRNVMGYHKGVDEVDKGQYNQVQETDFATGCCMLVKKEVFEKAGIFDEKFFLYYEDSDLSERVRKTGYKIIYTPNAMLWHKNASSSGGSGSMLQDYYITRNRLFFGLRYASLRSKLALIKESFKLLINGRRWQKQGVLDFYMKRLGKGNYSI